MIKYAQGDCSIEEIMQIKEALEYGYFGMAYKVSELEIEIQKFLDTDRDVVCVNTGTSALHLALDAIGIGQGDEVILPSFTFVATAQAVTACRGTPVFADINDKLVMDSAEVEKRITKNTKAIILVHYYGQPTDMDAMILLSKKYGLRLIEDAAHAFGSYYKNRKIGSFGDVTCFSFDSIKMMTCGEGGAVVSNDKKLIEIVRQKRLLGMKRASMTDINWKNRALPYDVETNGFRYHMSNINAAIGLAQIKKISNFIQYRSSLVQRYRCLLTDSKIINFYNFDYETNAHFMMPVQIKHGYRDELKKYLLSKEIETNISYTPIHMFSFYKKYASGDFSKTSLVFDTILSLPLHTKLTTADVDYIAKAIKDFENEKIN